MIALVRLLDTHTMNIHIGAAITDSMSVGFIPNIIHIITSPPPSDRYIRINVPMYSDLSWNWSPWTPLITDINDYWTNRYDVWSTKFELIYGETWEQALDMKNKSKATPSTLRQPTDEEHQEFAESILNADINTLVGQGV